MCSNVYDDVADFKVCEFIKKHKNVNRSRTKQKIQGLYYGKK